VSISATITIPPGGFVDNERRIEELSEGLLLQLSDRASKRGQLAIREAMKASGLGNLGNALGQTSDLKKTGRVFRRNGRVSASGTIYIRTRSPRSVGAIISYTEGATITPKRGDLLWFPTEQIQRRVRVPLPRSGGGRSAGNIRLEPRYWNRLGLNRKFGPLIRITGKGGTPLLIVKNPAVNEASGRVVGRTPKGRLRKGSVERKAIVAFVGIPQTVRGKRVNPQQLVAQAVAEAKNLVGA